MRTFVALVAAIAVIGTACLGEGGGAPHPVSAQPGGATNSDSRSGPGGVVWSVRASVGRPARLRSKLPACPAGATCVARRLRRVTFAGGGHPWGLISTRRFTCPAHGTVASADCRAIATLRDVLAHTRALTCACPAMVGISGAATARIGRRTVTVPLDFCTYCDRSPRRSEHALRVLLPPAA
jgi:hypothetical protein